LLLEVVIFLLTLILLTLYDQNITFCFPLTSTHSQINFRMRICLCLIVKKNCRYTGYDWR